MSNTAITTPAEKLAAGALLTDTDIAAYFGLALQTVRNWRGLGEGPAFIRVGKRAIRYKPTDVLAFMGEAS